MNAHVGCSASDRPPRSALNLRIALVQTPIPQVWYDLAEYEFSLGEVDRAAQVYRQAVEVCDIRQYFSRVKRVVFYALFFFVCCFATLPPS